MPTMFSGSPVEDYRKPIITLSVYQYEPDSLVHSWQLSILSLNNRRVDHAVIYFCRLSRTISSPRKSLLKRNNCLFIVC